MRRIAEAIGVSRSHLHARLQVDAKPRRRYQKTQDAALLPVIRRLVDTRPTYGYRRITALLRRELAKDHQPRVNHKRVYRIMKQNGLFLARHSAQRPGRLHDGKVMVMRSNLRLCSEVLELLCWNGEIVRIAFVIDARDREIFAWRAVVGIGISGSQVRDLMLETVEKRYGTLRAPSPVEWLSDNGSPYTARDTRDSPPSSTWFRASRRSRVPNPTAWRRPSCEPSSATTRASSPCPMPAPCSGSLAGDLTTTISITHIQGSACARPASSSLPNNLPRCPDKRGQQHDTKLGAKFCQQKLFHKSNDAVYLRFGDLIPLCMKRVVSQLWHNIQH